MAIIQLNYLSKALLKNSLMSLLSYQPNTLDNGKYDIY